MGLYYLWLIVPNLVYPSKGILTAGDESRKTLSPPLAVRGDRAAGARFTVVAILAAERAGFDGYGADGFSTTASSIAWTFGQIYSGCEFCLDFDKKQARIEHMGTVPSPRFTRSFLVGIS